MSRMPHDYAQTEQRGYFSEFDAPQHHGHRFPNPYAAPDEKVKGIGRSHTPSERRSRKTSTTSNRDLIRVLLEDRIHSERLQEQLERAHDHLEIETRRANEAERHALEAKARLMGVTQGRLTAQQEAQRALTELKLYKLQFEKAQLQLVRANEIIEQTDAERERAEQAAEKARRTAKKYRDEQLAQRAREDGRRQGIQEGRREGFGEGRLIGFGAIARAPETRQRFPLDEDVEDRGIIADDQVAVRPRDRAPDNQVDAGPPSGRQAATGRQTPMRARTATRTEMPLDAPVPDHIIIRSPARDNGREVDRPSSSHASTPHSRHVRRASLPTYASSSGSTSSPESLARPLPRSHRTVPSGLGLSGIPEGDSSGSLPVRNRSFRDSYRAESPRAEANNTRLPQEEIFPVAPQHTTQVHSPEHPSSVVANFEDQVYHRPRTSSVVSDGSSSTERTATTTMQSPRVSQLRRTHRRWSSTNSVPQITIQPPSRPESVNTILTATTRPYLLSPDFVVQPLPVPERPLSRRGERSLTPEMGANTLPPVIAELPPGFVPIGPVTPGPAIPPSLPANELPLGFIPTDFTPSTETASLADEGLPSPPDPNSNPALRHPQPVAVSPPTSVLNSPSLRRQSGRGSLISDDARTPGIPTAPRSGPDDYFTLDHQRHFGNQFRDPASLTPSEQNSPRYAALRHMNGSRHPTPSPLSRPFDTGLPRRPSSAFSVPSRASSATPTRAGLVYPRTPGPPDSPSSTSSTSSSSRTRTAHRVPLPASSAGDGSRPSSRQYLRTPYRRPSSSMDGLDY